jgi:hypothetical protein
MLVIEDSRRLPRKLPSKVQERLLKVVVTLRRNFIVLQFSVSKKKIVLQVLPVERNLLCFDLPVLHIKLVTTMHDWDVFADPASRTMISFHQRCVDYNTSEVRGLHTCTNHSAKLEHFCMSAAT